MSTLSKSDIQSASDISTEIVLVPEWGGSVAVRQLTGTERDAFEASLVRTLPDGARQADLADMRAKLCAACMVDGVTGDRLFGDSEVASLGNKNATALERVYKVAQRINGLGIDGVKEAEKNSAAAPSGSSTSA